MSATPPEVTIWTDADHAAMVGEVLEAMEGRVRPIGVGGPRVGPVDELARSCHCPRADDFRKLTVDRPATLVLLACTEDVAAEDLLAVCRQGSILLALEPPAADFTQLRTLAAPPQAAVARTVLLPGFTQAPGFRRAADPYEVLGEQRVVGYVSCGRPHAGSLFARLFDAWRTVLGFIHLPETIDASITPLAELSDDLRRMTGRMAAHARVPGAGAAVLQIADQAGEDRRYLHVVGEQAEVRITDTGYDLRQVDGSIIDRGEVTSAGLGYIELVAMQWRRLLDRLDLEMPQTAALHRDRETLACCMACLLSARTGQPEQPRKLLEMQR